MTILFDLDGTLLNTKPDFEKAFKNLLAEKNLNIKIPNNFTSLISAGTNSMIKNVLNIDPEDSEFMALRNKFLSLYLETNFVETKAFPGIKDLLVAIEKLSLTWGIVTNRLERFTEPLLKKFDYFERAACVVCGDTTAYKKPHPEPLFYACRKLKIKPQECMYIGDADRDILAGNTAGMTTIAALFGYIPSKEEALNWPAAYFANTVEDILPWITKWYNERIVPAKN